MFLRALRALALWCHEKYGNLQEQLSQFCFAQFAQEILARLNDGVDHFLFAFLQGVDFFFDGVLGDKLIDLDGLLLTDAISSVGGLVFDSRIPPGVIVDDHVRAGEVEACAAGF